MKFLINFLYYSLFFKKHLFLYKSKNLILFFNFILLQYEIYLRERLFIKFFKIYFFTLENIVGIKPVIKKIYFNVKLKKKIKKLPLVIVLNLFLKKKMLLDYLNFFFVYLINFNVIVNKAFNFHSNIHVSTRRVCNFLQLKLKNLNDLLNIFYFNIESNDVEFNLTNYFVILNNKYNKQFFFNFNKFIYKYKKL